jgi:cell division septation protein DedD
VENTSEALNPSDRVAPKRWRSIGPRSDRIAFSIRRRTFNWVMGSVLFAVGVAFAAGYALGRRSGNHALLESTPTVLAGAVEETIPAAESPAKSPSSRPPAQPEVPVAAAKLTKTPVPAETSAAPAPRALDLEIGPAAPSAQFGVQLGAFPELSEAKRFVESHARELADKKIRIVPIRISGRGTWHRVRIGSFEARTDADEARRRLPPELREGAIVVSYR